jgi:hypothetical protein
MLGGLALYFTIKVDVFLSTLQQLLGLYQEVQRGAFQIQMYSSNNNSQNVVI